MKEIQLEFITDTAITMPAISHSGAHSYVVLVQKMESVKLH